MRYLVTGATGFVGKYLCKHLIANGHQVIAISRKDISMPQIENFFVSDLANYQEVVPAFANVDVVIHLAGRAHKIHDKSVNPLEEFRKVNVNITANICTCAAASGVKRLIFISTAGVHGEHTSGTPFTETSIPKPLSDYSLSKLEAELQVKDILSPTSTDFIILRPPLIYGPECPGNFLRLLRLIDKLPILPFNCFNQKRSFIYVENLVSAIQTAAHSPQISNSFFLISDGSNFSLHELTSKVQFLLGKKICLRLHIPLKLLSGCCSLFGISSTFNKLANELLIDGTYFQTKTNWKPSITPDEALKNTVSWYKG